MHSCMCLEMYDRVVCTTVRRASKAGAGFSFSSCFPGLKILHGGNETDTLRTDSDRSFISVLGWKTVREATKSGMSMRKWRYCTINKYCTCRNVLVCILAVNFVGQPRFFIYFIIRQTLLSQFSRRWWSIRSLVQLVLTFFPFSSSSPSSSSSFLSFFVGLLQLTTLG